VASPARKRRNLALRKIAEHRVKRTWHLARSHCTEAAKHLAWIRVWRNHAQQALADLRRDRQHTKGRVACGLRTKYTFRSVKNFLTRPRITPRVIILHSTESNPGSGFNIGSYLSHGSTQADVHVVIDTDGTRYRLVPDGRKAWHVGARNGDTLGIEQVGRAKQESWPHAQVRAAACQTATWCRKYDIPVQHSTIRGIAYHRDVSGPGGHWDPGYHYPLDKFLALVREFLDAAD
jgi:N-acetyl-anhydromuramyl-L-alanine amidase AmpD